jgi:hypothetical protein
MTEHLSTLYLAAFLRLFRSRTSVVFYCEDYAPVFGIRGYYYVFRLIVSAFQNLHLPGPSGRPGKINQ